MPVAPSFASLGHMKRQRFAAELWRHGDLVLAYRRATGAKSTNPHALRATAGKMLADPLTQQYLADEFSRLRDRMALDQDQHAQAVCELAYSDLGDICTWGPDGVTLFASDQIPVAARRAIQSVKSTTKKRLVPGADGELVQETETRTEVTLHPKVPALTLLHTMFDRGQTVRQHLETKLKELAGLAAQFIPVEQHAHYLAAVRMVMGDGNLPLSPPPAPADE